MKKTGVLLLNLGTPDDPSTKSVARYLREFLMDPLVIDIPYVLRWILVHLIIAPFRSKKSAHAYEKIWTERGSPLKFHTRDLAEKVANELGHAYEVKFAMRYQKPSIESVFREWDLGQIEDLRVIPLYPHYALSSTESSLRRVREFINELKLQTKIVETKSFFADDFFVKNLAKQIQRFQRDADFILFSYHGLPVRHITKLDSSGHCQASPLCCQNPGERIQFCYRAQCRQTTEKVAELLMLDRARYMFSFQSRLGRAEWIKPETEAVLVELAKKGVKKVAVICPAFICDCLETLEEIQIRARELFLANGGVDLWLIPCLNSDGDWAKDLANFISRC